MTKQRNSMSKQGQMWRKVWPITHHYNQLNKREGAEKFLPSHPLGFSWWPLCSASLLLGKAFSWRTRSLRSIEGNFRERGHKNFFKGKENTQTLQSMTLLADKKSRNEEYSRVKWRKREPHLSRNQMHVSYLSLSPDHLSQGWNTPAVPTPSLSSLRRSTFSKCRGFCALSEPESKTFSGKSENATAGYILGINFVQISVFRS